MTIQIVKKQAAGETKTNRVEAPFEFAEKQN